jgi:ABC-2 type transport system ATP-binding protein
MTIVNVSKSFGSKRALHNISFAIEQGKVFGFLGPNGAGKTTLIRSLMNFIYPDSGAITIAGLDSRRDSVELKRRIGYLPSDGHLYGAWTGEDHLRFVSDLRGVALSHDTTNLLDVDTKTKVKHLSTGNLQKLGIAVALVGRPDILVLDEPTRGLDPILQNQLYELLADFRAGGGTVFMSSHNLPEVDKLCDSVAVIRDGKIIVEETLESLRHKNIHHVSVTFADKVEPNLFKLSNIEIVSASAQTYNLRVKGDLTPVIHLIARHQLTALEVSHASLEELFLELYR